MEAWVTTSIWKCYSSWTVANVMWLGDCPAGYGRKPQPGLWSQGIWSIIVRAIAGIEAGFTTVIRIADQSSTDSRLRSKNERGIAWPKLKMDGRSIGALQNPVRQYRPSVSTESGAEWYLGIMLDKDWRDLTFEMRSVISGVWLWVSSRLPWQGYHFLRKRLFAEYRVDRRSGGRWIGNYSEAVAWEIL